MRFPALHHTRYDFFEINASIHAYMYIAIHAYIHIYACAYLCPRSGCVPSAAACAAGRDCSDMMTT